MPYINEEMKSHKIDLIAEATENEPEQFNNIPFIDKVDDVIKHIRYIDPEDQEGVVNYTISRIVAGSFRPDTGWRYKWLNRAYGTFLSAAAEFYRRLVAPYEDKAIAKNGDIPEYGQ